ncbi:hypothetical protein HY522_11615 [bacterium]|nr:hypothetical protein [bacterium]
MTRPARAAAARLLVIFGMTAAGCFAASAEDAPRPAFSGMDEAVNERMAENAGAAPRSPYIDTESLGDIWNMLLLGAGGICGFVIGRWWHLLFGNRGKAE